MRHEIEPVWRKAHEIPAIVTWLVIAVIMWLVSEHGAGMAGYPKVLSVMALLFAVVRTSQVLVLWERKARLVQIGDLEMSGNQVMALVKKAQKKARKGKLRIEG